MDRIPGGSSGGSGAAVAARHVCGRSRVRHRWFGAIASVYKWISGLRPTHGRVPIMCCTPVSASFDTIGPMARSVTDVARIFAVIAGYDSRDPGVSINLFKLSTKPQ